MGIYKRTADPDWGFRAGVSQGNLPRVCDNPGQFEEEAGQKNWNCYWSERIQPVSPE